MREMDDEELTRQAAEELLRDARKFMAKRNAEFRATQMKTPMKANKVFLNNTIKNVVSYNKNKRIGSMRKEDKNKMNTKKVKEGDNR